MSQVHVKTLKNINFSKTRVQRAGFILYTLYKGNIYFMIGIDSKTHELTDFAGGIKYKTDRHVLSGAIRELQEETLDMFEPVTYDDVKDCITIYDDKNLVIFMPTSLDPDTVCCEFNNKYREAIEKKKFEDPEVCGITWLDIDEFSLHIKNPGIIYSRVQSLLLKAGDFLKLL